MNLPQVVAYDAWQAASAELLAKEKAATRARDALNAERRRMPMVKSRQTISLRGAGWLGQPARFVRRPHSADPLPLHVRAK